MPSNGKDLVEVRLNPPDLIQRMSRYPKELDKEMDKATEQAMLYVWGNVPPYPAKRPGGYQRTGTLGRSLGSSMSGGTTGGTPDIYTVKRIGQGKYEGRFGTRLHYAPDVIGSQTQKQLFKKIGWWTMKTIKEKSEKGIQKIFDSMAKRLVKLIGG